MRSRRALLAALIAAALVVQPAVAAGKPVPRASLMNIENDVMCPSCHEPLALAQSPQAVAEKAYIKGLIAQGMTKKQIEDNLVTQYGVQVLGRPPAHGFNLTVYILPPAIVLAGIALLVFTLPKWRQRSRDAKPLAAGPPLTEAEDERINEDLARLI